MNAGKSIDLLKVAHNYEEQGKSVIIMTSSLDNRSGESVVSSRIGVSRSATPIYRYTNIFVEIENSDYTPIPDCILVDEAQFLTTQQVEQLSRIVDYYGIPVICFGLRTDFQGNLFEGSKALFELADKIEEIKTLCWFCIKKATMNIRYLDGKPVNEGEQIKIGGNESYKPVCRKHYYELQIE